MDLSKEKVVKENKLSWNSICYGDEDLVKIEKS